MYARAYVNTMRTASRKQLCISTSVTQSQLTYVRGRTGWKAIRVVVLLMMEDLRLRSLGSARFLLAQNFNEG
eukprot:SAG11_NODE_6689_length_1266_cov_0.807198_1_plen_72_part_00